MAVDIDVQIGLNLKKEREAKGLNQKDLAKILGVKYQVLSRYENGKGGLSTARIKQIANALRIPVTNILMFSEASNPRNPTDKEILDRIQTAFAALNENLIPSTILEKIAKLDESSRETIIEVLEANLDALLNESTDKEELG